MKVLTWNINSVRLRIDLLMRLLNEEKPDIVCIQETKCPDNKFPFEAINNAGYTNIHINGMKGYNGVAILSLFPFLETSTISHCGKDDSRHISVKVKPKDKEIDIHCLYIPAGGDEPDTEINPKFKHKLDFIESLSDWFSRNTPTDSNAISLGDFNIAPLENDVWSHKQLLNVVSHTPIETESLDRMKASINWHDAIRHFIPKEEKAYSWWSYRNRDWKKSNRGRRLDHIWVTQPMTELLKDYKIKTESRDWEKPSDHVPVMVEIDL